MICVLCGRDHDGACSMTHIQEYKRRQAEMKVSEILVVGKNSKNKFEPKVRFDRSEFMKEKWRKRNAASRS